MSEDDQPSDEQLLITALRYASESARHAARGFDQLAANMATVSQAYSALVVAREAAEHRAQKAEAELWYKSRQQARNSPQVGILPCSTELTNDLIEVELDEQARGYLD